MEDKQQAENYELELELETQKVIADDFTTMGMMMGMMMGKGHVDSEMRMAGNHNGHRNRKHKQNRN